MTKTDMKKFMPELYEEIYGGQTDPAADVKAEVILQ